MNTLHTPRGSSMTLIIRRGVSGTTRSAVGSSIDDDGVAASDDEDDDCLDMVLMMKRKRETMLRSDSSPRWPWYYELDTCRSFPPILYMTILIGREDPCCCIIICADKESQERNYN